MTQTMDHALELYNQINGSSNPAQLLNTMATMNPKLNETMSLINNEYGGDPKAAFYDQAKKKGVDPNQTLASMRKFGFR